jgi:hypothetical protein
MRLISVAALLSLVRLKESTEAGPTGAKIRSVLVPREYTRLDQLVDVIFTAAKDVEAAAASEQPDTSGESTGVKTESSSWEFTDPQVLDAKREKALQALAQRDGKRLVKRSRALYWDTSHTYRAACTISK